MADYPLVPIEIVSTPADWLTISSSFLAAFFGAGAAFAFSIILQRLQQRREKLDKINAAIYGLGVSFGVLLNLKEQLLFKFRDEFKKAMEVLSRLNPSADENFTISLIQSAGIILESVRRQDPKLNGAFIPWQAVEFPMLPEPADFHFTALGNSNLPRLLHIAKVESEQVTENIRARNLYWREKTDPVMESMRKDPLNPSILGYQLQMLSYREIIETHSDTAIVVILEVIADLENYRSKFLKKRRGIKRWVAELFVDKETWTSFKPAERVNALIPSKEKYRDIIEMKLS